MLDQFDRPLRSLRISVTDRCNLRCTYCMPEPNYIWLPRKDLLSFEEIFRLASIFQSLGVERLRITGGEPLLRHDLPVLIKKLCSLGFSDVALTTNGVLLAESAAELKSAGLNRLSVSLDSLRPADFEKMAQKASLPAVLQGLREIRELQFKDTKLDTVIVRGRNHEQIVELLDYARAIEAEIRFIEYMDVGGATRWRESDVVTRAEILAEVSRRYGSVEPLPDRGSAPAERFRLPHGQVFGIIASVSQPFCGDCDRGRLTADGHFLLCLYAHSGLDLRQALRDGSDDDTLRELIRTDWRARQARGAEERAGLPRRASFRSLEDLRRDPRLEMHTRGG